VVKTNIFAFYGYLKLNVGTSSHPTMELKRKKKGEKEIRTN
jgi:hypothetical protein